jgi:hypothetical protein
MIISQEKPSIQQSGFARWLVISFGPCLPGIRA